ncbi:MAG: bifunctional metallophosphatase/5'-nucleotidase [Clostridia bacterium]|nr:bifunctional metallophosphatase/5'-nucleotidase [Clostridia bacterium]
MSNRLTVYFTSDTHGYLYPTNFQDQNPHPMGVFSMRFPKDENTLIIDGGDTIQGSPLIYYCRTQGRPLPVAQALNDRGYDYVTLGNHDFNLGRERLTAYLRELKAECLCANVQDDEKQIPVAPWAIRVMGNGLRVGLVGIVTDWINRWEKPENRRGFRITDPLEAARQAVGQIRAQVDVLIGIYHGGIEKELRTGRLMSDTNENIACRLCEELPFDLILAGHQHMPFPGGEWAGTWLVQPPANAEGYVRIRMDEDFRFSSEIMPVPNHADLRPEEKQLYADLNAWLDRPVGHLERAMWPKAHLEMALEGCDIADLINQVQLNVSRAEISCVSLANSVRGFSKDVTVRDVVATYVYSNTLTVLEVNGIVLKEALEQCASFFDVREDGSIRVGASFLEPKEAYYNYDYYAGIEYEFDLNKPVGSRVVKLNRNGKPIRPEEILTLAMNDYRATGSGGYDFFRNCTRIRDIQTDVSELILDEIRKRPVFQILKHHAYRVIRQGR